MEKGKKDWDSATATFRRRGTIPNLPDMRRS